MGDDTIAAHEMENKEEYCSLKCLCIKSIVVAVLLFGGHSFLLSLMGLFGG